MLKKFFFTALTCLFMVLISGCNPVSNSSTNTSSLVGTWDWVSTTTKYSTGNSSVSTSGSLFSCKYIFRSDYTLSVPAVVLGLSVTYSGKWSATSDSVVITVPDTAESIKYGYVISSDTLTISRIYLDGTATVSDVEIYTKE
jgi:hypothetical protein